VILSNDDIDDDLDWSLKLL